MSLSKNITIIILAGGKSSRMGQDKGLMYVGNKTMIEHIINTAEKITEKIILITANQAYSIYKYPIYADIIPNKGPLGGIYTGLTKSDTEKNLILSCDTPFVETNLLQFLISKSTNADITVGTTNGKLQPLLGIYAKSCLPIVKQHLVEDKLKLADLLEKIKTKEVALDEFDAKNFLNLNSPSDL